MKKKKFLQIKIGNDIYPSSRKDIKKYKKFFKKLFKKELEESDMVVVITPHQVNFEKHKFTKK